MVERPSAENSKADPTYNTVDFIRTALGVDQTHELYDNIETIPVAHFDNTNNDDGDGMYEALSDNLDSNQAYNTIASQQPSYEMARQKQQPIYNFTATEDETDFDL